MIKQVVVLAGSHQVANSILPGLEQLGLQICDHFSVEAQWIRKHDPLRSWL